ncbi:MAG: hypothetical protein ACLVKR_02250 [Lachnospiraceae bacterium]
MKKGRDAAAALPDVRRMPSLAKRWRIKRYATCRFHPHEALLNLHITTSDFFKGEIFVPLDEENKRQHALFLEQKEKDKKKKK